MTKNVTSIISGHFVVNTAKQTEVIIIEIDAEKALRSLFDFN